MNNLRTWIVLAISAVLLLPISSTASVIVFDPTNFGVNLEQVSHHLALIARLDRQIRNQLDMLENWRFTRLDQLLASMQQIRNAVEGVASLDLGGSYSVAPADYAGRDASAMRHLRRARLESHRAALVLSRTTQEKVVAEMPGTQLRIGEYVRRARIAPGQTAALQATNETVATLAGQLQSLQALELSEIRVELEAEARRQAEATFHRQRRDALMRDWAATRSARSAVSGAVRLPFVQR